MDQADRDSNITSNPNLPPRDLFRNNVLYLYRDAMHRLQRALVPNNSSPSILQSPQIYKEQLEEHAAQHPNGSYVGKTDGYLALIANSLAVYGETQAVAMRTLADAIKLRASNASVESAALKFDSTKPITQSPRKSIAAYVMKSVGDETIAQMGSKYNAGEMAIAARIYDTISDVFRFAAFAPTRSGKDASRDTGFMEMSHRARRNVTQNFLDLLNRGLTGPEALILYDEIFSQQHLRTFLEKFETPEVKHFEKGVFAELLSAVTLRSQGFEVTLADDQQERMGIDMIAKRHDIPKPVAVQIKGEYEREKMETYVMPFQQDELKQWIAVSKFPDRYRKDLQVLETVTKEKDMTAMWLLVPSNSARIGELARDGKLGFMTE